MKKEYWIKLPKGSDSYRRLKLWSAKNDKPMNKFVEWLLLSILDSDGEIFDSRIRKIYEEESKKEGL